VFSLPFFLGVVITKPNELANVFFFFFFFFFFDDDDDDDDDERATSHRSGQVRGRTERAESGREEGTHLSSLRARCSRMI
jgi:hypothetical protein